MRDIMILSTKTNEIKIKRHIVFIGLISLVGTQMSFITVGEAKNACS